MAIIRRSTSHAPQPVEDEVPFRPAFDLLADLRRRTAERVRIAAIGTALFLLTSPRPAERGAWRDAARGEGVDRMPLPREANHAARSDSRDQSTRRARR